jgi:hypothetical protein
VRRLSPGEDTLKGFKVLAHIADDIGDEIATSRSGPTVLGILSPCYA